MAVTRLRELRKKRGFKSVQALADRVGFPQQTLNRLETGETRLNEDHLQRLATGLGVAPQDLLAPTGTPVSVPLRYVVGLAEDARVTDGPELAAPWRREAPPSRLRASEQCFAALVADDSASHMYPAGTMLFVRARAALGRPLKIGDKVLVRRFALAPGGARRVWEALAGRLDRTGPGDLVLLLRSADPRAPLSVPIQHAPMERGVAERFAAFAAPADAAVAYEPDAADPAEILGVIEYATTPE